MARTVFTRVRWGITSSVTLTGVAMLVYPGGTLRDPSTSGYSFFQNFLSDLGATVAWGGQPNYMSEALFGVGFGVLAVAGVGCTVGFMKLYGSSSSARSIARVATATAVLSCVALFGVALTPADRFLALHVQLSSLTLAAAGVACLLFAVASVREQRLHVGVGLAWVALALVPAILFSVGRWGPGLATANGLTVQVTTQKLAALALLIIGTYLSYQGDRVLRRSRRSAV